MRHLAPMKRRTFLLAGLGAGGALFVGWALRPPRQRLRGNHLPDTAADVVALNGWVTIGTDDVVTVVVPKMEMGQGIHTGLAMVLAEELGCAWDRVRVAPSPIDDVYGNVSGFVEGLPFHPDDDQAVVRGVQWLAAKTARELGIMMTGSSSSMRDCWMPMREAGASARASMVAVAAARFGVSPEQCRVERGVISHGERHLRFGELAAEAAAHPVRGVPLKALSASTVMGTAMPRLDVAQSARGQLLYGSDVSLPGMRYAAVTMSPTFGGRPAGFDAAAAMRVPGVDAVVPLAGSRYGDAAGVAVVADTWWTAHRALSTLAVRWDEGPHAALSSATIRAHLRAKVAEDSGLPIRRTGDASAAFARAARVIDAEYDVPYLAHAAMEPLNATVRVTDQGAELWTATQVPNYARDAVADIARRDLADVIVHQQIAGGAFGRRLDVDFIAQATAIAAAVPGVPVQLLWSREDDMRHDVYRPAASAHLRAALDGDQMITAFTAHSAGQAPFASNSRRVGFTIGSYLPDRTATEGAWDQPYEFPSLRVAHTTVSLPVPVGMWRSVGHSQQAFFVESFLDEIAAATGQDPVALRLSLLRAHPRAQQVLRTVAERSGWGTALAPRSDGQPRARGVALHAAYGTTVAEVAEVSLSPSGQIRVHRVVAAMDCGFAVHPGSVTQQIEGGIIFGLSAALHEEVAIAEGRAVPDNFHTYRPLRLSECPVIETHLIPSMEMPSGVGEPPVPPIAPAVANAVFALTGTRIRSLPLRMPSAGADP